MALSRPIQALITLVLAFVLFVAWYVVATGYDYGDLAGTYTFNGNGQSSTLVLKANRTFRQELRHDGKVDHATGTWRRIGEGGVVFSGEFLRLNGQRSFADTPGSDASQHPEIAPEFYGHFEKILTVYLKLSLDGGSNEVVLHKRIFP